MQTFCIGKYRDNDRGVLTENPTMCKNRAINIAFLNIKSCRACETHRLVEQVVNRCGGGLAIVKSPCQRTEALK